MSKVPSTWWQVLISRGVQVVSKTPNVSQVRSYQSYSWNTQNIKRFIPYSRPHVGGSLSSVTKNCSDCVSSSWIYKILATNDLLLLTTRNKPILKIQNGKHKIWKRSIKLDHTIFYLHFAVVMFLAGHHGNGKVWGKLTTAKLIAEVHKGYI